MRGWHTVECPTSCLESSRRNTRLRASVDTTLEQLLALRDGSIFPLKFGLIQVFLLLIKGTTSIQLYKPQTLVIPLSYYSICNPQVLLIFPPKYYLIIYFLPFPLNPHTIISHLDYNSLLNSSTYIYYGCLQTIILTILRIIFSKYKFTTSCLKPFNGFPLLLGKQHKRKQNSVT